MNGPEKWSWFEKGLVALAGFIVLAGFKAVSAPEVTFAQVLNHQGLAAWVQAFGSIGAIIAAVYVVDRQAKKQRDHEVERADLQHLRSALRFRNKSVKVIGMPMLNESQREIERLSVMDPNLLEQFAAELKVELSLLDQVSTVNDKGQMLLMHAEFYPKAMRKYVDALSLGEGATAVQHSCRAALIISAGFVIESQLRVAEQVESLRVAFIERHGYEPRAIL